MRKDEIKKLKIYITLSILTTISIICFFSYLHYKKYHYIDKGELVATINDFKIYKNDLQSRIDFLAGEMNRKNLKLEDLDPKVLKAILIEIYTNNMILKLAKEKKLFENNDFKFLAKEYHERLIKEAYIRKFVTDTVAENEIKEEYDRLVKIVENKEERKIRHILVSTEEEINRIRNTIIHKNNFEKMAELKSIDKPSAINGGNIGYVMKEEITIPEFADIAFLLKVGELSKPVQTKEGWHLIRVDDVRDIKMKSYKESRSNILDKLEKKRFSDFINSLLKNKNIDEDFTINIINNDVVIGNRDDEFDIYDNDNDYNDNKEEEEEIENNTNIGMFINNKIQSTL
mgnify:CR=1 FL=1